jgi:cyclohexanecarboxylate-CoA ligase
VTFWGLVRRAADEEPDRVILADDHGRSLTTTQLRDAAERTAAALPVEAGSTVSWQLPTSLEGVVLMAALTRLGVRQNPIIPQLRSREVGVIVSQVQPTLYIAPRTWRGFAHGDMAEELGCRVLTLDLEGHAGPGLCLPENDPATLAASPTTNAHWVYYSSGTTSNPKGVAHTDSSLIAGAQGLIDHATFGYPDIYPIAWPLTHIGGVTMVATALQAGLQLVLFDTWDPTTTPERMAAHHPTILGSAQPFFRAYLDAQRRHGVEPLFPHLRLITAGGAPTPPEVVRELIETFGVRGVMNSYGLTEFPIASAPTPDDAEDLLLRSVGTPGPGAQARVVHGEVRLKGPQCFSGYLDPSLDAAAFDEDGWFRTGDVGHIDAAGNVFITGRLKDVIIRNAENISALEVEDALLQHPGVADVAVIGLPDTRTGERVCAVIVPRGDAAFDVSTVAAHCRAHGLASYKCPEQIAIVPALERNAMGKLLKQELRDQLLQA